MLALAIFLLAGVSQAQLRYGVKVGANVTNFKTDNALIDNVNMAPGYQLGVLMQYKFFGFAIQPELLYSEKSVTLKDANASAYLTTYANLSAEDPDMKLSLKTIEIPLNIQYGIKLGKTYVYAQGGPYVSFLLGGSINGDKDAYKNVNNHFEFNKVNYGLGAGAGVEYKKYQISARYDFGLNPVGKETLNSISEANMNPFYDMKSRNLSVSVAYLF